MKISAIVVLYNPDISAFHSINSYREQVDFIYIVDNSTKKNHELLNKLTTLNNVEIIENDGNLGIAKALNIGVTKAIKNGFELVLTMDQDSVASSDLITNLLKNYNYLDKPGIISPHHENINYKKEKSLADFEEVEVVMTSGNLLNLTAYQDVGGFDENLFIDYVDIDLCLKLRLHNYKIYKINSVILQHNEGNLRTVKIFNKSFRPYNHNSVRWYYKIRNYNVLKSKFADSFPEYFNEEKKRIIKDVLKILLFEKNKLTKFKFIIKGFVDFGKGVTGKCPEQD